MFRQHVFGLLRVFAYHFELNIVGFLQETADVWNKSYRKPTQAIHKLKVCTFSALSALPSDCQADIQQVRSFTSSKYDFTGNNLLKCGSNEKS